MLAFEISVLNNLHEMLLYFLFIVCDILKLFSVLNLIQIFDHTDLAI